MKNYLLKTISYYFLKNIFWELSGSKKIKRILINQLIENLSHLIPLSLKRRGGRGEVYHWILLRKNNYSFNNKLHFNHFFYSYSTLIYHSLIITILLTSCTNSNSQQKSKSLILHSNNTPNKQLSKTKKTYACIQPKYSKNNFFNNNVSLLTGDKQSSQYQILYDSSYWEMYHEFIQISWQKLEQQRLNKIRKWREQELKALDTLTHTIFYPFSGPDFLTVSILFPQADTFVMLGLEPVGALPDFSKMSAQYQQEYLSSFSESLGDIFNKSYFITKKMLHDFQAQKVNGLLPVLTFFIKKLNYDIIDIQYIYKDSTNKIKEIPYSSKKNQKPFGVHIVAAKDSCTKNIYYFRYNVMDKYFNDSTNFYRYLSKFNNYITYIKSASYLLHNPFMTNMRNLILKNSLSILQDDTGVPYRFLNDSNQWQLKIYGQYDKPVKDFGKMGYQPDLAKKMKEDSLNIPKLPFHLGYHWGSKKDVLLLAIKKHK